MSAEHPIEGRLTPTHGQSNTNTNTSTADPVQVVCESEPTRTNFPSPREPNPPRVQIPPPTVALPSHVTNLSNAPSTPSRSDFFTLPGLSFVRGASQPNTPLMPQKSLNIPPSSQSSSNTPNYSSASNPHSFAQSVPQSNLQKPKSSLFSSIATFSITGSTSSGVAPISNMSNTNQSQSQHHNIPSQQLRNQPSDSLSINKGSSSSKLSATVASHQPRSLTRSESHSMQSHYHGHHFHHPGHPPIRQGQDFDLSRLEPTLRSQVTCPACKRLMADPRLTPCLHAACASCLRALIQIGAEKDKDLAADESVLSTSLKEIKGLETLSTSSSAVLSISSSTTLSPQSSLNPNIVHNTSAATPALTAALTPSPPAITSSTPMTTGNTASASPDLSTQTQQPLTTASQPIPVGMHQNQNQNPITPKTAATLVCPACAEEVIVPYDVDRLPPARLQMNLVDAAQIQLWASDPNAAPLYCTSCNELAVSVCLDGCWLLCQFCHLAHPRLLATSKHHVKELSKVSVNELHRPQPCTEHPDHSLVFFCLSCKILVCSLCLDDHHVHHPREAIDKAARTQRSILSQNIVKVQERKLIKQAAVQKIIHTSELLQKRAAQTRENIHQYFSALIEKLREREAALSNQVDSIAHAKSTVLRLQLDSINYGISDVDEALGFAKKALDMDNDTEMLSIYPSVCARIASLCGSTLAHDPAEGPHIEFFTDHDVEGQFGDLLEKVGAIRVDVPVVCPSSSIARGHGLHTAFIEQEAYVHLRAKDEDGTDVLHGGHSVQVQLSCPEGSHVVATVHDRQDGSYVISYTPKAEGLYTISILINGEMISGSPFKVNAVQRSITNIGVPLGKFGSRGIRPGTFLHPFGIAIDPKTKFVYVSDCEAHRIQVFQPDGAFTRSFGSYGNGPGEFHTPSGLAISKSGMLAVADTENHRIQVFRTDGTFIHSFGSFGSSPGQLNNPDSLTFDSNNNIIVTEWGNHRVQIFSSEGVFVTKFGGQGSLDGQFQFPRGVAVDYGNHILVADRNNHRIQMFSNKGVFILKFGAKGTNSGQFNAPSGVSVDLDGHIFVTDFHNNRVQIFSSNGTFLHQFGSLGGAEGKFHGPRAIVADQIGKLYITEYGNQRIQIF